MERSVRTFVSVEEGSWWGVDGTIMCAGVHYSSIETSLDGKLRVWT